jgi:hypothetical protein
VNQFFICRWQECYITTISSQSRHGGGPVVESLEKLAEASDTISLNDVIGGNIMASQDWGALRYVAALCTGTGSIANGFCGGFPGFPVWFGKNSKRSKCQRLLNDMAMNLKGTISGSPDAVRQVCLLAVCARHGSWPGGGLGGLLSFAPPNMAARSPDQQIVNATLFVLHRAVSCTAPAEKTALYSLHHRRPPPEVDQFGSFRVSCNRSSPKFRGDWRIPS